MLGPRFHTLINVIDSMTPAWLKHQIRTLNPGLVERFYHQIARNTSDQVVEVRIQTGELAGRPFFCSLKHQRSCYLGNFEPPTADALREFLSPGGVCFDVGSHIGYFTLMSASLVRPNGIVVAFEPDPANLAHLKRNLDVNPDLAAIVRVEQSAVSEAVGIAAFERGSNSYVGHLSLTASKGDLQVTSTTLDSFVDQTGVSPNFIKMDIEGAECLAFRGMSMSLNRSRPTLLVEVHNLDCHTAFLQLLRRHSYVGRRLEADEVFTGEPLWSGATQYLAIPK